MPLNIDWQQILLHMLNFTILFAVLYFLLYKPVKSFMDNRSEQYKKLDEDAKQKLADAENIKAEYEQKLSNVDNEIATKKYEAEKEAALQADERVAEARSEAEQILETARREAAKEHDDILASAQKEIVGMATAMAEKIVTKSTAEAYDQFLNTVERGKKNV